MKCNNPLRSNPNSLIPTHNTTVGGVVANPLMDRTNNAAGNVFLTMAPVRQASNRSFPTPEIIKIKDQLEVWGKTQSLNNQANVEKAKLLILECYKNKAFELILNDLNLTSIPIDVLQKCKNLKHLSLKNNRLIDFNESNLFNLRLLNLSNNQLTSFNGDGFFKLVKLDLSNNQLTSLNWTESSDLSELDVSNNPNLRELPLSLSMSGYLIKIDKLGTQIENPLVDYILAFSALRSQLCGSLTGKVELKKEDLLNVNLDFVNRTKDEDNALIYKWLDRLEKPNLASKWLDPLEIFSKNSKSTN